MHFVFSHVEYFDMHFVYGFCDGNARAAVDEYQRRFADRRIPSVAVQSERKVVPLINTRENILEMVQGHNCPLIELSLASACHVCRCGERYMRKIYILIMITGYNIWNQGTLLNIWICANG